MLPTHHTTRFSTLTLADLSPTARVVFADSRTEDRNTLPVWAELLATAPARCVVVRDQRAETFSLGGTGEIVALRDFARLERLLLGSEELIIDVTGLDHGIWAPMLRVGRGLFDSVGIVYAEPSEYKSHPSPSSSAPFDLTASSRGIAPLPGFAKTVDEEDEAVLVLFLGFEGNRASHVAAQYEHVKEVVPVVGVPGYRMEYPSWAVTCNAQVLSERDAYHNIRLARANSPSEAYATLAQVQQDFPGCFLYIAPIGTKPHALGAINFALDHDDRTEIVYDHPVRKAGGTSGIGRVNMYRIGGTRVDP